MFGTSLAFCIKFSHSTIKTSFYCTHLTEFFLPLAQNKNRNQMTMHALRHLLWALLIIMPIHTNAKVIAFGTWGRNGNNVTWVLDDDTLFFRGYGSMQTFDHQYANDTRPWKKYAERICRVEIEEGITSIGDLLCYGFNRLEAINIPGSVLTIGKSAFNHCSKLKEIELPNSLLTIEGGAFCDCSSLKSITIPNSVSSIGNTAFTRCESLTSVVLSVGLTRLSGSLFSTCSNLRSIIIPEKVTQIEGFTFKDCSQLRYIDMPAGLVSIDRMAFEGCNGVEDVYCRSLYPPKTDMQFPQFANQHNDTIMGCLHVPSRSIEDYRSLSPWKKFREIVAIDDSVTITDGDGGLGYQFDKTTMTAAVRNSSWLSEDDVIIPFTTKYDGRSYRVTQIKPYAFKGKTEVTSVKMSNSVNAIGQFAFAGCYNLQSVQMPQNLKAIEDYTFSDCYGLTSVDMPENISTIGEGAFADCVRLKEITLPYSLTEIGDFAFSGCASATTINIQCKETSIGGHCFDGCFSVTDVYCTTGIIPDADVTAFSNINPDAVLHVPADVIEEYRTTAPWCDFKHIVAIGQEEDTEYISSIQYVFYPEDHTATVVNVVVQNTDRLVIPGTVEVANEIYHVTTIEKDVCHRNQDLKHIEIEEGVIEIQNSVFYECRNLESVVIPNSVEFIGDHAFSYCHNLRSVKIGTGLKKLRNAFTAHSSVFDLWCNAEQVPATDDINVNYFQFGEETQATLHVPASALEAYQSTFPWSKFKNIVPITDEEMGIPENVMTETMRNGSVYNLQGLRINTLQKGINIINGNKIMVK